MVYEPKNFDHLIGTPGFSDTLLKNHFTLYQGYVTNVNKLTDLLSAMSGEGKSNSPEFAELKRRLGWEWNGMRLHELYFGNMTKERNEVSETFKSRLTPDFETWEKDFRATAAMRGIGWVILYHDREADRLFNIWVNEHDLGNLAGCNPLLVLDVFEHAYTLDYGIKKADYLEAFFKAIDWRAVERRFTGE